MCLPLIRIKKAPNNLLNKISDDWNMDKLALLITYLKASNLDVSLTGFDENDITDLLKTENNTHVDDFNVHGERNKPTFSKTDYFPHLGRSPCQ